MFTGIVEELGVVTAVDAQSESSALTIACQTVLGDVSHGASIAVNGVCLTVTSYTAPDPGPGGAPTPSGPVAPSGPGIAARPGAGLTPAASDGACTGTGESRASPAGLAGAVAVATPPVTAPTAPTAPAATAASTLTTEFTADVMRETLVRSSLGELAVGDLVNLERPVRLADRLGGHLVQGHVDGVGVVLDRQPGERWEVVRITLPAGLDRYLVEKGSVTVDGVSLTVVDVSAATRDSPASFTVSLIPTTLELTTLGRRAPGSTVNIEVDVLAKYVEKLHAGATDWNGSQR